MKHTAKLISTLLTVSTIVIAAGSVKAEWSVEALSQPSIVQIAQDNGVWSDRHQRIIPSTTPLGAQSVQGARERLLRLQRTVPNRATSSDSPQNGTTTICPDGSVLSSSQQVYTNAPGSQVTQQQQTVQSCGSQQP